MAIPTTNRPGAQAMTTERQPNESAKAYAAFRAYCEMGSERTAEKVAAKYKRSVSLIRRWAAVHKWTARVKLHDQRIQSKLTEEEDRALRKQAGQWAKRQIELREQQYELGLQLLEKFRQVYGLSIRPRRRGKSTIKEINVSVADLPRLA